MEKFKKPRLLTPRGQSHKKFWQAVGLCALTAAIFFLPFYILDGGFFHYAGDFNSQQITFYRYMNGFVKGAGYPDSAFAGAPRNTFSWATDLGSGVMNAYSFYLYGSPFFWLSVLLPQSWLPYMMVPLLVLKFGVAGGGAFLYLRRYVKNENYAVLGACLYALSGFAVYNVFFNHFVDVVALFPYLLWALDEAIYENRHGLFAFWVAVNLLNNYFFFVGQVLFLVIYFVCKLSAGEFRLTPRLFGQLAFESLLGVALGFVAGETGAWLERGLAAQGLKTDFVHLENGMTRINVKIKAGQETELNGAGPAIPESALQQLEAQLDKLAEGDILILAGSIPASLPQSVYERLLARLQGRGVRAVVDATRDLLVNVLPYHPFLIKPNNHELGEIVGKVLTTDAEIVAAARTLQEKGARNVLVSMAGDGALLLDEQGQVHRIGCPKGKVVNSVGAGDSMVAGFVAGYLQSRSYAQALRLGTACGSATAFSLGLATKEKIDELLAQL